MTQTYREFVKARFGGVLSHGNHAPNGAACSIEAYNAWRGRPWSDIPYDTIDIRPLNDALWPDDSTRTENMMAVMEAVVIPWPTWSAERQQAWAKRVAIRTVREILPVVLTAAGLVDEAERCAGATTIDECKAAAEEAANAEATAAATTAAEAARSAVVWSASEWTAKAAAWTAKAAANMAEAAAWTAKAAVLIAACAIWVEEAEATANDRS